MTVPCTNNSTTKTRYIWAYERFDNWFDTLDESGRSKVISAMLVIILAIFVVPFVTITVANNNDWVTGFGWSWVILAMAGLGGKLLFPLIAELVWTIVRPIRYIRGLFR
jgi:hypothetical protein